MSSMKITSREAVLYSFIEQLEKDKAELLEALKYVMSAHGEQLTSAFEQAQDAIARATKGEAK